MTDQIGKTTPGHLPVHLDQPCAGFSCLHIGPYKIGIAITTEDGTQDPEAAGAALEFVVQAVNGFEKMREALEKIAQLDKRGLSTEEHNYECGSQHAFIEASNIARSALGEARVSEDER